jgi:hypothetical protein
LKEKNIQEQKQEIDELRRMKWLKKKLEKFIQMQ